MILRTVGISPLLLVLRLLVIGRRSTTARCKLRPEGERRPKFGAGAGGRVRQHLRFVKGAFASPPIRIPADSELGCHLGLEFPGGRKVSLDQNFVQDPLLTPFLRANLGSRPRLSSLVSPTFRLSKAKTRDDDAKT